MLRPSYIKLLESGGLEERRDKALAQLKFCRLCPRNCGVDRTKGELGHCRTGRQARVASYNPHFGEEAPLVGTHGSGTIFFSSCNLLCAFCQNYDISHMRDGYEVEPNQLADMMLDLAGQGCHNINFVTPTHVVPQILEAVMIAAGKGLELPLIYNSGGYDSVRTLHLLEGIFDIYMPDFKFWDNQWSVRYCDVSDYRERAVAAIREMHRQVGDLVLADGKIATRGLLVRHLVMPGNIAGTAGIMKFLAREISPDTYVNVMAQYRPCGKARGDIAIGHPLLAQEFAAALSAARAAGLTRLDRS